MQKTVTILTLNNLHYRKHIQKDKIDYLYTKLLALKENTRQNTTKQKQKTDTDTKIKTK